MDIPHTYGSHVSDGTTYKRFNEPFLPLAYCAQRSAVLVPGYE